MHKVIRYIVVFIFLIHSLNVVAISLPAARGGKGWYLEDFRFGGGVGNAFYLSNQMDYAITRNYGAFDEVRPTYFGAIYKAINDDFEMGFHYRHGSMQTLKSENTQGSQCDFDEAQFNVAYSFNHNIRLTESRFTVNGTIGLGGTYFKSMYFTVDQDAKEIDEIYASVGYGGSTLSRKDQAKKQAAVIGNFGVSLGFRLFKNMTLYWENNVNISTSNKMSGNLHKRSWIPPDGYFFTGIGLFINITPSRGRLSCPKF
jgi:hypothetical protein